MIENWEGGYINCTYDPLHIMGGEIEYNYYIGSFN